MAVFEPLVLRDFSALANEERLRAMRLRAASVWVPLLTRERRSALLTIAAAVTPTTTADEFRRLVDETGLADDVKQAVDHSLGDINSPPYTDDDAAFDPRNLSDKGRRALASYIIAEAVQHARAQRAVGNVRHATNEAQHPVGIRQRAGRFLESLSTLDVIVPTMPARTLRQIENDLARHQRVVVLKAHFPSSFGDLEVLHDSLFHLYGHGHDLVFNAFKPMQPIILENEQDRVFERVVDRGMYEAMFEMISERLDQREQGEFAEGELRTAMVISDYALSFVAVRRLCNHVIDVGVDTAIADLSNPDAPIDPENGVRWRDIRAYREIVRPTLPEKDRVVVLKAEILREVVTTLARSLADDVHANQEQFLIDDWIRGELDDCLRVHEGGVEPAFADIGLKMVRLVRGELPKLPPEKQSADTQRFDFSKQFSTLVFESLLATRVVLELLERSAVQVGAGEEIWRPIKAAVNAAESQALMDCARLVGVRDLPGRSTLAIGRDIAPTPEGWV